VGIFVYAYMGMKYIYKFPKDANGTEMEAMRQFFNKRYVEWEFSVINGSDLVTWGGCSPTSFAMMTIQADTYFQAYRDGERSK